MADIDKLRQDLEAFKSDRRSEYEFKPLENWITKNLGATKIETGKSVGKKKGKGSIRTYRHESLKIENGTGHFLVHVIHKRRPMIRRINFLRRVYPVLRKIIDNMESEEKCEEA